MYWEEWHQRPTFCRLEPKSGFDTALSRHRCLLPLPAACCLLPLGMLQAIVVRQELDERKAEAAAAAAARHAEAEARGEAPAEPPPRAAAGAYTPPEWGGVPEG